MRNSQIRNSIYIVAIILGFCPFGASAQRESRASLEAQRIAIIKEIDSLKKEMTKIVTEYSKTTIQYLPNDALAEETKSFNLFWKRFRTAALKMDTMQIIALTQFPFKGRGTLDSDQVREFSKRTFVVTFKAFLNQWNGTDLEGNTELDNIKKTVTASKNDIGLTYARIGDMEFKRIKNKWNLVSVYLNNETVERLEKKK